MVHIPAKFRENIVIHFRVTVRKLNVTDARTDGQTGGGGGVSISPVPGFREAGDKNSNEQSNDVTKKYQNFLFLWGERCQALACGGARYLPSLMALLLL